MYKICQVSFIDVVCIKECKPGTLLENIGIEKKKKVIIEHAKFKIW